jgi:hypothetical protein
MWPWMWSRRLADVATDVDVVVAVKLDVAKDEEVPRMEMCGPMYDSMAVQQLLSFDCIIDFSPTRSVFLLLFVKLG